MLLKEKKYCIILTLVFYFLPSAINNTVFAQKKDSITVVLNNTVFSKGDSINIEVSLLKYKTIAKTATIQLWIENLITGKKWKFRYPLINGYINAKLIIDSNMAYGTYAFNFLLQKTFFTLNGHVAKAGKKETQLNYIIISKAKQTVINTVNINEQKSFTINNLLFPDSAFIIFSKPNQKNNELLIDINTPLDSAFEPSAFCTKFVTIGKAEDEENEKIDTTAYNFNPYDTQYKIILPDVVIKTRAGKKMEDFVKDNVTGSFLDNDAIILDGLNSNELAQATDIYTYLAIKVGGLQLVSNNETGGRFFIWRGQPTDLFLNEIKLDPETPFWINPSDIAMIKIFRPGTSLAAGSGGGGTIAIYTKTGEYKLSKSRNYSFYIVGYTAAESTWK